MYFFFNDEAHNNHYYDLLNFYAIGFIQIINFKF
jgi:hypothetical protein